MKLRIIKKQIIICFCKMLRKRRVRKTFINTPIGVRTTQPPERLSFNTTFIRVYNINQHNYEKKINSAH